MKNTIYKITKILLLFLLLFSAEAYSQITAIHFNAEWNKSNDVEWFGKLKECEKESLFIEKEGVQKKYEIAVVPTIIIFKDGDEVKRFQADISFTMPATREDIQEFIDDLIMSEF